MHASINKTQSQNAKKLGILAGGGSLPQHVIEHCKQQKRPYFVLAFQGQTPIETVNDTPHAWITLGQVGKALALLKEAQVEEIVMIGHLRRPSWSELKTDSVGARMLARLAFRGVGDDGILRLVTETLEKEGFHVIGVENILGTSILAPVGIIGRHKPDTQAEKDIARGLEVVKMLGLVDVGQAVVVQEGLVLGVEAIEGTDALIQRTAQLRRTGNGGVLVKIAKPNQEKRVDLPTIGVKTIQEAVKAGLQGIAMQANATLLANRDEIIRVADDSNLFLIGLEIAS